LAESYADRRRVRLSDFSGSASIEPCSRRKSNAESDFPTPGQGRPAGQSANSANNVKLAHPEHRNATAFWHISAETSRGGRDAGGWLNPLLKPFPESDVGGAGTTIRTEEG
jgi:hypothetical protein